MTRQQQVKCGHCNGRGKIRDEYANRTNICPTCGGSGQVQAK
jgi:DnaJ-class molecular chaperone